MSYSPYVIDNTGRLRKRYTFDEETEIWRNFWIPKNEPRNLYEALKTYGSGKKDDKLQKEVDEAVKSFIAGQNLNGNYLFITPSETDPSVMNYINFDGSKDVRDKIDSYPVVKDFVDKNFRGKNDYVTVRNMHKKSVAEGVIHDKDTNSYLLYTPHGDARKMILSTIMSNKELGGMKFPTSEGFISQTPTAISSVSSKIDYDIQPDIDMVFIQNHPMSTNKEFQYTIAEKLKDILINNGHEELAKKSKNKPELIAHILNKHIDTSKELDFDINDFRLTPASYKKKQIDVGIKDVKDMSSAIDLVSSVTKKLDVGGRTSKMDTELDIFSEYTYKKLDGTITSDEKKDLDIIKNNLSKNYTYASEMKKNERSIEADYGLHLVEQSLDTQKDQAIESYLNLLKGNTKKQPNFFKDIDNAIFKFGGVDTDDIKRRIDKLRAQKDEIREEAIKKYSDYLMNLRIDFKAKLPEKQDMMKQITLDLGNRKSEVYDTIFNNLIGNHSDSIQNYENFNSTNQKKLKDYKQMLKKELTDKEKDMDPIREYSNDFDKQQRDYFKNKVNNMEINYGGTFKHVINQKVRELIQAEYDDVDKFELEMENLDYTHIDNFNKNLGYVSKGFPNLVDKIDLKILDTAYDQIIELSKKLENNGKHEEAEELKELIPKKKDKKKYASKSDESDKSDEDVILSDVESEGDLDLTPETKKEPPKPDTKTPEKEPEKKPKEEPEKKEQGKGKTAKRSRKKSKSPAKYVVNLTPKKKSKGK
jgi:hypothetical protein